MLCSKCRKKCSSKAQYCRYCGKKFSEEERKKAAYAGFVGLLRRYDDLKDILTGNKILGDVRFKIAVLLVVIILGIYNYVSISNVIKIQSDSSYEVTYNSNRDEYYVTLNEQFADDGLSKLHLNLYVPNKIEKIVVTNYSSGNEKLDEDVYTKEEEIILNANLTENNYYIITGDGNLETALKVFVYYKE